MFAYVRIFREIFARRRERSVGALGAGVSKPEDYHWIKVDKAILNLKNLTRRSIPGPCTRKGWRPSWRLRLEGCFGGCAIISLIPKVSILLDVTTAIVICAFGFGNDVVALRAA